MATLIGDAKIRVVLDLDEAKKQLAAAKQSAGGPGAQPFGPSPSPTAPTTSGAPTSSPPARERLTEASIERKRLLDELSAHWQKRDAMFDRVKARAAKFKVSGGTDEADFSWIPGGAVTSPLRSVLGRAATATGAGPELSTLGKIGAIGAAGYAAASFLGTNLNTIIEAIKPALPEALRDSDLLKGITDQLEELRGSFIRLESAVAAIVSSGMSTAEQLQAGVLLTGELPAAGSMWNMNWQVERNQRALDAKLKHERRDEIAATLAPVLAKAFKGSFSR